MTLEEARELVGSPIWDKVRDLYLASGTFTVHPEGDLRRLDYLDQGVRDEITLWQRGLREAEGWKTVVDGARVRELKAEFPGVYPEAMRYTAYFNKFLAGAADGEFPAAATKLLLKLKFPEAYELCFGTSAEHPKND